MDTFADLMASERERINDERATLRDQLHVVERALHTLDREELAIAAYEQAKNGKAPKARKVSNGTVRARRGSKREDIVATVTANPQGLSRGELLELLGIKGDKSGEMSVSNALTAMTKNNTLTRTVDGKKYVLA